MPTTDNLPRGRPRSAVIGASATATAQVAIAALRLFRCSHPSGPTCANAAASDTPCAPTSAKTTSDGLARRGVSASSASASNSRSGTPRSRARATIAGSSAFNAMVLTQASASGAIPASASAASTSARRSAGGQFRAQPTPSAKRCGANCRCSGPRPAAGDAPQVIVSPLPAGSPFSQWASPASGPVICAPWPDRRRAIASFASPGLTSRQPGGGASSATPRLTSPAVVTAATAPSASAIRAASRFAPRCPPSSGTTTPPSSLTETTGGSAALSASKGATPRIRMPLAQTPTMGTPAAKRSRA